MLRLPEEILTRLLEHLNEVYPQEGCGLLAGREGLVTRLYRVTNRLASPVAYEMVPEEQLAAILDLEARGLELLAIYHSHPSGPEIPSASDLAQAYYPDQAYLIVSLRDRTAPVVRSFVLAGGSAAEVGLEIV